MVVPTPTLAWSERARLRRKKERGSHERALVDAILDEGLICHVGVTEGGATWVLPMTYARIHDRLYLHGVPANHVLSVLASGAETCLTVTLLDGLVFSRSAFHHSMNYRSVMLFGTAVAVDDLDEKRAALLATVDHMAPGRSTDARPPSDAELRSTRVVCIPIEEGSAKVRTGGPIEDAEDLALAVWAGVLPLELTAGPPMRDAVDPVLPVPRYVEQFDRSRGSLLGRA